MCCKSLKSIRQMAFVVMMITLFSATAALAASFSSLSASPNPAKLGTAVSISFVAVGKIPSRAPVVTVNGHSATYKSRSAAQYLYSYTVQSSDAEGYASIVVSSTGYTTLTSTNLLTIDNTAPSLYLQTSPSYLSLGNPTLYISVAASEALAADPVVTVNGNPTTLTYANGTYYAYSYNLQPTDSEGYATVSVSASDLAGNPASTGNIVPVDLTAPTLYIRVSPLTSTSTMVYVSVQASERLATDPTVTVNGNAATLTGSNPDSYYYTYAYPIQPGSISSATVQATCTDVAGNPGSGSAFVWVTP